MYTLSYTEDIDYTESIQKILDKISKNGGGTLTINPGKYRISNIELFSNTTLELCAGSVLIASDKIDDYNLRTFSTAELSNQAVVYSKHSENVRITGSGEIWGNSAGYFAKEKDAYGYKMPNKYRPRIIVFEDCVNIKLDNFTIKDSPMWTTHIVSSSKVFIHNLTIDNAMDLPNTDALDIDSCQHVFISNCFLSAADDSICIKTTDKSKMPEHFLKETKFVTINNCTLRSKSCAFKLGTETFYDITDITCSNLAIYETNRAVGFLPRDGGSFKRISMQNFTIETDFAPPVHWGKAEPICVTVRPRVTGVGKIPKVEYLSFSNFLIKSKGPISFFSDDPKQLTNVTLSNISIEMVDDPDSTERCLYDIRPPINPGNPTGMGLDNAYCINEKTGLPFGVDYYKDGMPAVYGQNVDKKEFVMSNVTISRPAQLPKGWSKEKISFV